MISLDPIGYVHCSYKEKADSPRQGSLTQGTATISLIEGKNFEQGIEDLKGMERIWILSWLHGVHNWKNKVQPPRVCGKKGVFATRSPHRPNPIGLSCVKLISIQGRNLYIQEHDLLDGTPVLDIKPYVVYADSFPEAKMGWIEQTPSKNIVEWSEEALEQATIIGSEEGVDLKEKIRARLEFFEEPSNSNRIQRIAENLYLQAYQYWRITFLQKGDHLQVVSIVDSRKSAIVY